MLVTKYEQLLVLRSTCRLILSFVLSAAAHGAVCAQCAVCMQTAGCRREASAVWLQGRVQSPAFLMLTTI